MGNVKAVGDFDVAKDCANQFLYVANSLINDDGYASFLANTMYPYAVNISFACELFIKAIMIYESNSNEFIKGHNLMDLYVSLDQKYKSQIETEVSKIYTYSTLDDFLQENGNVFVDWRYALEKGVKINIAGFKAFSKVLSDIVNSL